MSSEIHTNVAGRDERKAYAGNMENEVQAKLTMFHAVKEVCQAKPWVWQQSPAFQDAFADFCGSLKSIAELLPARAVFQSVAKQIDREISVAETILTTDMDELIERFEFVDVAFVDAYTAARTGDPMDANPPTAAP
jgi:hypothetical protein